MFYKLPHDVQTIISSYDSDFMVKKFIIYMQNYKLNTNILNNNSITVKKLKKNIQFHCKHSHVMVESDHDYHKPRYDYYCKYCFQTLDNRILMEEKMKRQYTYY